MNLRERQETYKRELAVKQAVLEMKKDNLTKAKEALASCISDRDNVKAEERSVNTQIEAKDRQIADVKKNIDEQTSLITSLQKELSGVFLFSFGRKKELNEKIAAAQRKLSLNKSKFGQLTLEYSELVKERKEALLESLEDRVTEHEKTVTALEKEISDIKNEMLQINASIAECGAEIQRQIDAEKKTAELRFDEKTKNEEARLTEEIAASDSESVEGETEGTTIPCDEHHGGYTVVANEMELRKGKEFYVNESLVPYFQRYSVHAEDYSEINVESLGFSVRLENRLLNNGYKTVDELLQVNDSTLRQISGLGQGCLNELHDYLGMLSSSPVSSGSNSNQNVGMTADLAPYKEQILYGDFSFLDGLEIDIKSEQIINKFKEAHSVLDYELMEEAINGAPEVFEIMEMLHGFISYVEDSKRVDRIVNCIPIHRLEEKASWVIKCFTDSETVLSILQNYIADDSQSLRNYLYANYEQIGADNQWFTKLVKWCQYNLSDDIKNFFVDQMKNERELRVINGRANRKTLEEVGKEENVTRERIRQIEAKAIRRFGIWQKRQRIMFKIFLEKGKETGLSSLEIIDCIGDYGKEFVYLMKGCETEEVRYDKQLDMFVIENVSLTEKIQAYVESLPDAFPEKQLREFLKEAEENDYPEKMVLAVLEDSYKKTGDTYHRFRLTLTTIYGDIMKKYYPEGIHVYDPEEIEHFRRYVVEDYSMDISGKSDHAIGSILSRIGILCGRGIYKMRQEKNYISKDLAKRIHDYIEESSSPIFMTNTLFSIFEEDLLVEGIDNKYFLQGILRDLYENEWIFRRDYISKDESYTSVYSSIVGFVRNSRYPVSKEDLNREFPGVTEIVINLSVSDPNIINLFGEYIHSCRLKLSESDIRYLRETVEDFLDSKEVCHCKEIYEYIDSDYPVLLTNNFVQYPFSLYSLLEYLFGEQYNFSRPYVARKNATIERALDVLKDIVKESDRMEISEIQAFAREHKAIVYSIREFIDSCNATHLLISDFEVASIVYIGVTEEMAKDLENRIAMEINDTVPIHQLQCIHSLPKINVEWNAWLIYSVLKKWATKLEVGASASQFRQSYPIVAPIGKLDFSCIDETEGNHDGKIFVADDLSNIDELVSEFILDGLEDIDEL